MHLDVIGANGHHVDITSTTDGPRPRLIIFDETGLGAVMELDPNERQRLRNVLDHIDKEVRGG